MTTPIRWLTFLFLFGTLMGAAHAATVNAASCSSSDVQKAIDSSSSGDTVKIPAGACTWSGLSIKKVTTLEGAGGATSGTSCPLSGATRISLSGSGIVSISKQASGPIYIKGLAFNASGGGEGNFPIHVDGDWQSTQPVIFQNDSFCMSNTGMVELAPPGGLIFSHLYSVGGTRDSTFRVHGQQDDESWRSNDTMGNKDADGRLNIYVEDSTFWGQTNGICDADSGARLVVRNNSFTYGGINSHGYDTSFYGLRHFEVYNNTFADPNASTNEISNVNQFVWIRGGTGVIYNNDMANLSNGQWGVKPELRLNIRAGAEPGTIGESCSSISYPIQGHAGQLGQNWKNGDFFTDPIYLWGNTGTWTSAVSADFGWPPQCSYPVSTFFQWGRDGINPASKGGSAKPGYTAFTYPHPLAKGTGGSGSAPAPGAPSGLEAIVN